MVKANEKKTETKKDLYQIITNKFIEALENGIIPWQKPWGGVAGGAYNVVSKRPYSYLNQLCLKHEGAYATYKQWQEKGGQVRKGEKSEMVVFWKFLKTKEKDEDGEEKIKRFPILRYYNVFHISQVDGDKIDKLREKLDEKANINKDFKPIEKAEEIFRDYIEREGIKYEEEASDRAYYAPMRDLIHLPERTQFKEVEEFYSTLYHETTHSTMKKGRCDRETDTLLASFGSENYSKEELVAEMGAGMALNKLGIDTEKSFNNSTAYIQSWLEVLRNDKKFIVSAAGKAEKAVKYIFNEATEVKDEEDEDN